MIVGVHVNENMEGKTEELRETKKGKEEGYNHL